MILYSLGIIFAPDTSSLQRTGIIYLTTIPSGAAIYLNNKQLSETTPVVIRDLPPGDYSVEIVLKNYKPWRKTLNVQETKATVAENILLIPPKWNTKKLSTGSFEKLIAFSDHPVFVLKKGPRLKDIFIFRWSDDLDKIVSEKIAHRRMAALSPLVSIMHPLAETKIRKITTAPGSPFILIETRWKGKLKYLWANLKSATPLLNNITELFPDRPDYILWNKGSPGGLFSLLKGALNHIDLSSESIRPHIIENVRTFNIFDHHIYAFTNDFCIQRFDENGKNPQFLLEATPWASTLFQEHKKIIMSVFLEKIILFLSENGTLLINQPPYQLAPQDIKGFQFDEINQRLLIWKNNDIGSIDFSQETKDEPFDKNLKIVWLNIPAQNIREAFWINSGANILFVDEDKVFITEARPFGTPEIHEVVSIKNKSSVFYAQNLGRLFYLGHETGHLMTLELIPKESLLSFPSLDNKKQRTANNNLPEEQ